MSKTQGDREVWITGVGLVSSLGDDAPAHVTRLFPNSASLPVLDATRYEPYSVHPLAALDFSKQIPKKSDQRQMELWQRIGVYAAGLALSDAGIAGNPELLDRTHLVVAAGSGERDTKVDCEVLDKLGPRDDTALLAKEVLPSALRPTLFLAQLSNMLAGNISIVHAVTGSSRTFMGEEMAGLAAVENAFRRIVAAQADLILVGGALNAEREDLLLGYEIGQNLWRGPYLPVWHRRERGGGFIPGSVGAFLMFESRSHAEMRGATAYARLAGVATDRSNREPGEVTSTMFHLFERMAAGIPAGPLPVLSGASGVEPVTSEEVIFLDNLATLGVEAATRAFGSMLGHCVEAQFPAGLAIAALSVRHGMLPSPSASSGVERAFSGAVERALVTCVGHWRGEGIAVVEKVD